MNKKIASEVVIGIIVLLAIVIGGIFYLQNKKDRTQIFTLKIGEKAIYKGTFNLEINLIEIGKIKDIKTSRFSEDQLKQIDGECADNDCKNILEDTYYVVKVKNLDWVEQCGEAREVIMTKDRQIEGFYDCPSFYTFNINPLNSSDNKIEFKVEYVPVSGDRDINKSCV